MRPRMAAVVSDPAGIARRLTELRENKGMSRHKLAWDLDVADNTLGTWERGQCVPSTYAVMKYAEYFGVTTDWILFGGKEDGAD